VIEINDRDQDVEKITLSRRRVHIVVELNDKGASISFVKPQGGNGGSPYNWLEIPRAQLSRCQHRPWKLKTGMGRISTNCL